MTPAARLAAAAQVLDEVLAGAPAERTLTNWARGARYAGSKDRAAVRDLVYDALRRRRSLGWAGGAETGRGLMLGALRLAGTDPATLMTGEGHALSPPTAAEVGRPIAEAPRAVRLDWPDWLLPRLDASLGAGADPGALALTARAPVTLRANLRKVTRDQAQAALAAEEIETQADPEVHTALHVTRGASKVAASQAYLTGLVELQDASSQAAVLRLPLRAGVRVLDYCAGGGGKTLAMGSLAPLDLVAHDADPRRMTDLPPRAARAGLTVALDTDPARKAPFDLVLVDAPCSGSGTWRRTPDAKWRLTSGRLDDLVRLQDTILDAAAPLVVPAGHLAYSTCSILAEECDDRIAAFRQRHTGWQVVDRFFVPPGDAGDGFFQSVLRRDEVLTIR
ncbi:RsmB/NOP family class I SAM-dependent RNA methyltransferase [Rubellimicrobium roseum]|uniref:RsmB/NOP family class I SAM-dependent RNA methyltransferase n=1 Tax=Rubellimicrobium roseum TaxID=687525 RepID=A0A5C4NDR3_9RHOB|nr:RsmB/NOP family class I SAM-dependent RNA methyltransferase [Rubellimicrobium roseum]TNC72030.1 RsmB/NOP family class I SAM-dependent RNA methyltransferase [Rubellimicrobium roseum]